MLDRARELAARGHYPIMIEAVLKANGFAEADEWIDPPHIRRAQRHRRSGPKGSIRPFYGTVRVGGHSAFLKKKYVRPPELRQNA
jgi:hypothetical protein